MKKRLITSFFILVVTLGFVLLKQFSPLFFDVFALIISYGSLYEILKIHKQSEITIDSLVLYLIPAILCLACNLISKEYLFVIYILIAVLLLIYSLTEEILTYANDRRLGLTEKNVEKLNQNLFVKTKNTMKVFAYPILPLSFMFMINHMSYDIGYIGIILMFAIAMMTDSFALLFGRWFGKEKFIPEVSPKKTLAGVAGGFVGGIVAVVACYFVFLYAPWFSLIKTASKAVSITAFLIMAIFGSYVTQLGDLIASAYKRKVGIKDYSNIFPGHGGFMDRVDGMMFVSVVVYAVLTLFFV